MIEANQATTVLVADDSPEIRTRLVEALLELGNLEVIGPCTDGDEALQLFQAHSPDAVILDLQMPGIGGLDLITKIRERNTATIIIILTAHDSPVYRDRCLTAGANFFFSKNEELAEIVAALRSRGSDDSSA